MVYSRIDDWCVTTRCSRRSQGRFHSKVGNFKKAGASTSSSPHMRSVQWADPTENPEAVSMPTSAQQVLLLMAMKHIRVIVLIVLIIYIVIIFKQQTLSSCIRLVVVPNPTVQKNAPRHSCKEESGGLMIIITVERLTKRQEVQQGRKRTTLTYSNNEFTTKLKVTFFCFGCFYLRFDRKII